MRFRLAAFLLLVFSAPLHSQTTDKNEPRLAVRSAPQYIIRISSLHYFTSRLEKTCVIIYQDRSLHFERAQQLVKDEQPRLQIVSETKLSTQQIERLNRLLHDADVSSAEGDMGSAGIIPFHGESRSIEAEIPRGAERTQYITGASVAGRHVDPAVTSLIAFMDAIEAGDLPAVKDLKAAFCRAPRPKALKK
jgi:hypothetical protein